jgi:YidC/Oxa1 family membrane protein insertase
VFVFANVFQPLIDFFEWFLIFFHDDVGLGWGASIIVLTLLVRAALLPLAIKQFHSMQRLAKLQPEMKKLQEKYKNDRERLQQETMRFYREQKVNPFASCLPLLAQLPVFLALFYMLRKDLRHDICPEINPAHISNPRPCGETDASQFFFIPDLTNRTTGWVLALLLVMYVSSQLASGLLSMSQSTMDRNQRMLMLGLPVIFVAFIWQFPAGLLVYWITTNLWTIVQQTIIRRRLGPLRPQLATADAAAVTDGKGERPPPAKDKDKDRELVGASGAQQKRRSTPPPAPPRKRKKRSGRRR